MHVDHEVGRAAVLDAVRCLLDVAGGLEDDSLVARSRCRGWTVADVLLHLHLGLQEMLLGLVAPTTATPDTDAASYWASPPPATDPEADDVARIRFVRLVASAYRRPSGVVAHLRPTAEGILGAVAALPPGAVRFQGKVLTTGDFLATWATEVAVHHLDLTAELSLPEPPATALAVARATVEALAGGPLPAGWSDAYAVLAGAGRVTPAAVDTARTPAAARLPVLG